MPYAMNGCCGQLGDIQSAVAAMIAEKELGELMSSARSLNDSLFKIISDRNEIYKGYIEASSLNSAIKGMVDKPTITIGPVTLPAPAIFTGAKAVKTAELGVKQFSKEVVLAQNLSIVFMKVGEALSNSGLKSDADALRGITNQVNRFTGETDQLFRKIPAYSETKRKIIARADSLRSAMGVSLTDYGDARWFQALGQAAEEIVPSKEGASGLSGLGDLGLAPVVVLLIKAIISITAIVAATVAIIHAINKAIPDANSKAKTARDLLIAAEERKKAIEIEMRRQGKSEEEISKRMTAIEAETNKTIKEIPEPKSPLTAFLLPVGIAAAGILAAKFI